MKLREKTTATLLIAIFMISTFAVAIPVSAVQDRLVPSQYSTIQAAIDEADPGDTVLVAAGTYTENLVIDKSLTVKSIDGPEVTIIDGQMISFGVLIIGETTIATFEGFTVENYMRVGILAGAFSLSEDPVQVHILNNIISEPKSQQNNNGIQIGDGTTGTVIGNTVYGAYLVSPDWSGSGILVAGSSGVLISDNHVYNCEGGIQIAGYPYAPSVDNIVEYNLVEDCVTGISVQMNSHDTIVRLNDVLNNDVGIASVGYITYEEYLPSGTVINYNNIVGNENYGVKSSVWDGEVDEGEQVDATLNWWGHASGPGGLHGRITKGDKIIGQGDSVSVNVYWDPWLPQPVFQTPHDPVPPGLLE